MNTLATRKHALRGNHRGTRTSLAMLALISSTALAWSGVATAEETVVRDLGAPPAGNPYAEGDFNRADDGWLAADGAAVGGIGLNGAVIKDMGAPPTGNPYAEGFHADSGEAITNQLRGEGPALANERQPPTGNPNAEGYDAAGGAGDVLAGGDGVAQPGGMTPAMGGQGGGDLGGQLVATGRIETLQLDGGGAITLDNGETYVLNANEPFQADLNQGALVTFAYNIEGDHNRVVGTPQILE